MLAVSRRKITATAIACGFAAMFPAVILAQPPADDKALATALRAGGLVILVRHGATFADQADTDPFNFDNISTQRNLNDSGKTLARAFGEALRQAGVPVGKVYTSKFNRAYETATIAGFTDIEKTADLTEGGLVVTPNENNRRAEALRKLLATAPKPGTNTVLITHKPNILDALGKDWFDVKEGEASIFRPETGKYVLVARLQMADWPHVAGWAPRTSSRDLRWPVRQRHLALRDRPTQARRPLPATRPRPAPPSPDGGSRAAPGDAGPGSRVVGARGARAHRDRASIAPSSPARRDHACRARWPLGSGRGEIDRQEPWRDAVAAGPGTRWIPADVGRGGSA